MEDVVEDNQSASSIDNIDCADEDIVGIPVFGFLDKVTRINCL